MANDNFLNKAKGTQVSPALVIPVVVIVVVLFGYFFWLKPKMQADAALRNFNTPEEQAKRDPDKKKISPSTKAKLDEILAKETHLRGSNTPRHSDQ